MLDALKALLRPPEQKASRTARLIAMESGGRARWTPRDFAPLAREGYVRNAVVHRAVKLIAANAATIPLLLYEARRNARRIR
jgi:phage portal protein BeeE